MDDLLDIEEDDLLGDLDLGANDSSDDDLLGFDDDLDDLLDLESSPAKVDSKYATERITHSGLFVLEGESRNPNDYVKEAKALRKAGTNPFVVRDETAYDNFVYWLEAYNTRLITEQKVRSPFLATLAIQNLHCMRADACSLKVRFENSVQEGEIIACEKKGRKVKLAVNDADGPSLALWFNLDTGKVLDPEYNTFSLA